jgi:glycosyltransferase involved in cell wall biosynthesis
MISNNLYSIIIPTFNCGQKLVRALESTNGQTYSSFEVIVCDDGSTDNTKQIVDSFRDKFDIKYILNEHWGGPAHPRNNGIRMAKGHFIAFLDSDDIWYPKKLEIVNQYINKKKPDLVFHDLDIYSEKGRKLFSKVKGRKLRKPIFIDLMINENALINSSVVVKKDLIVQVGGLLEDKKIISLEDFDLWLKLSRITERFYYIPQSLGGYFIGTSCISREYDKKKERLGTLYNKHMVFLSNNHKIEANSILSYLIARTKLKTGRPLDAFEFFKISTKSKNLKFKLRSIIWILYIFIWKTINYEKK